MLTAPQIDVSDPYTVATNESLSLPYEEFNPEGTETIVFIHGAFASSKDWDLVVPCLLQPTPPTTSTISSPRTQPPPPPQQPSKYHLLLPDLPSHGRARNVDPFSVTSASNLIAQLIRTRAKNSIAHIVSLSLGAHIALDICARYPAVVATAFMSGLATAGEGSKPLGGVLGVGLPYIAYVWSKIENALPRSVVSWAMDGTDLRRSGEGGPVVTLSLCHAIFGSQGVFGDGTANKGGQTKGGKGESTTGRAQLRPWKARTLVVAAGKGGLVPSNDNPVVARAVAEIGSRSEEGGNAETKAVVHCRMRHPWNRQDPELFARSVIAWIERAEIVEGFELL